MSTTARGCCGPDCCGDEPVATLERREPVAAAATTAASAAATSTSTGEALREEVRARYGAAAKRASEGQSASCGCGTSCCSGDEEWDPITSDLYEEGQTQGIPAEALLASLGCGNPTALAALAPGETVLDLGSGGGIDVLLSAQRVGHTGKAYGLDMTDEMLKLARENQRRSGLTNVEFLRGEIENIPLPSATVDVIISNCVINLSADKARVISEAHRVLNPGGRFAVSDVVLRGELPEPVLKSMGLWTACISGALHEDEYRRLLAAAGFTDISIEPTRVYSREDVQALLDSAGLEDEGLVNVVEGKIMSAFVRATK
jgi:SAM-dependent methyltransferase